jgi:hypothetical protein
MADKEISIAEKIRAKAIEKFLDPNKIPKDPEQVKNLYKEIIDELQINKSWRNEARKTILKVMEEQGHLFSSESLAKESNNELVIKKAPEIPQPTTEPTPQPTQQTIPSASPHGTLPKGISESEKIEAGTQPIQFSQNISDQNTQSTEIKKPLTEQQMKNQKQFIKDSFGFVTELYIAMGIVEGNEEEKEELRKPKPLEQFKQSVDSYSDRVNQYLIDNNIALPTWLNLMGLIASGFMIFVVPVLKFGFVNKGSQKVKPKYDDSLKDVEVKLTQ